MCAAGLLAALSFCGNARAGDFGLTDIFGRSLNERGVLLVDWEGHIANPAVELRVTPPAGAGPFPTTATLTANCLRVYFDNPCRMGPGGPEKVLTFDSATSSVPVRVAIFPDRDDADELYQLVLRLNAGSVTNVFALRVLDEDVNRPNEFAVTVDFSRDATGFFADERHRAIVEQAAADWAYFLADPALEPVPAGAEHTFIWHTNGLAGGVWATNRAAFRGFLFYAHGILSEERRSSGAASAHAFQHTAAGALPLRRSGSYQAEVRGNYNDLGWFLTAGDDDWCVSGNQSFEPADLYSIAHHEVGHALFFSAAHPRFGEFKARGAVDAAEVVAYHGASPGVDAEEHFSASADRLSGRGAFGNEYHAAMPAGRWLVTRLDLLVARALGYPLRETSALRPLQLRGGALAGALAGAPYTVTLEPRGGIPAYDFKIVAGALPSGLQLDRFTGEISGVPDAAGPHDFTVALRGQDALAPAVRAAFSLTVLAPDGSVAENHAAAPARPASHALEPHAAPRAGNRPSVLSQAPNVRVP